MNNYKEYFDIDPEYFPAVNSDVIKKDPELWKKFFPHDTFVKLIQDVVSVLNHSTNRNIWVEGSYGTGKSHAVITLKKLLDASEEDTAAYFDAYPQLNKDLKKKFLGAKQNGRILTVHRYGSSSINGDNDLFLVIQESIEEALKDAGIENAGEDALKTSVIKYLSDPENKASFEVFVKGSYADLFGCDVDTIIKNLQEYDTPAVQELMRKIFRVANEKQIKAFTLDAPAICAWIHSIIVNNNLAELVFIWDEFTEYLKNNRDRLTGYQELLEKSQTENFCFIPVTHESASLLDNNSKTKIMGRFMSPTCKIELPENTAFQLMGAALKKKKELEADWLEIVEDLESRTEDARNSVRKIAKINDSELKGILPIQPYSAYLLKHISSSFNSNQRSMFDFIRNKVESTQIKTFQWFIENVGPDDMNPLLTVDYLWSFFYDSDKDGLAPNIRLILDNYSRFSPNLDNTEQRVLKTVLLLQALSAKTNNSVALLWPVKENIDIAFEGSDLENGEASRTADKLVRDHVLYCKKIAKGTEIYSIMTGEIDSSQIDAKKKQFNEKKTSDLVIEGHINDAFELSSDLKLRYIITPTGVTTFENVFNKCLDKAGSDARHIYVVSTYAKNSSEASDISRKIKEVFAKNPMCNVIFIDCSRTQLGDDKFNDWVDNSAQSAYYLTKDKSMSTTFQNYATQILSNWRANIIAKGQLILCTSKNPSGTNLANIDSLNEELRQYTLKRYALGLEHYQATSSMWMPSSLKMGAECGINQQTRNLYKSANKNTQLEKALDGAWGIENYWEKQPSLIISQIKAALNNLIENRLQDDGRVSMNAIYDSLKELPVAVLPCNMTAFIMGFLLKEYTNGKYNWSDGITRDELDGNKMQELIEEVIKNDMSYNTRLREKFIVTMSKEEKAFIETTATSFHLSKSSCSTTEQARENVRSQMKGLVFPIWTIKGILSEMATTTDTSIIETTIDWYCNLANNNGTKTDSEIAQEIGKLSLQNLSLAKDLALLFTKDVCRTGMLAYLKTFEMGKLTTLADKIDDGGQYINVIKDKFDADAAAWVWKKETVDIKIREVILEYEIIYTSQQYVGKSKKLSEMFGHWEDKCKTIRLPYASVKNEVGKLDKFLSILLEIAQNGRLLSDKLPVFLDSVNKYGDSFVTFCDSQKSFFKKIYTLDLKDFSDDDVSAIFSKLPLGGFKMDKVMFASQLSQIIDEYKKQQGSQKLRQLWKEKTATVSPRDWSETYGMPIFIMLTDEQLNIYRKVFHTINNPNDNQSVIYAIDQLMKATFFDDLSDSAKRDSAFRKAIVGQLSTMLNDVEEVKKYLRVVISTSPFDWGDYMPTIKTKLNQLAESKYNQGGYEKAFKKIDSMDAEEVKTYLRDMIKNNMTVGIEIINS